MHRHCCWLSYRFVPLWKQENCPHRITLCGDYRDGLGSREERKSALLVQERIQQGALVQIPSEADTYALGIRQMLTPIPNHPLLLMRSIRDKINAARFPNDANESFLLLWERSA
jgi:hypothetical protein